MKHIFVIMLLLFGIASIVTAEERIVFSGLPAIRISEGGVERIPQILEGSEAYEYKCTITKIGDKYYWTTRENVPMVKVESGAFTTFVAVTGSGYVRIISSSFKEIASFWMSPTEKEFDYVEHLLIGLRSVTYFGHITK